MAHRLIPGPWHPDLESRLLREIRDRKAKDPLRPVVALVGSNLLGLYLARRLALLGTPHLGVRFFTWVDLARELAEDALIAGGLRPLPPDADLFAAGELAARLTPDAYFHPVAERPGFHRALQRTLGDLANAGWAEILDEQPRKVAELFDLLRGYRALLRGRCYDAADLLRAAAERAEGFRRRFGCDELLLYGVHRVHELQWRLLMACGKHVQLTALVPLGGPLLSGAPRDFVQRLRATGFRFEPAHDGQGGAGAEPARSTALARLQRWTAGAERDVFAGAPPDGSFAVISAPTPAAEAHAAAREALSLAAAGVPLREIGVVARNLSEYGPLLRDALGRAGTGCYLPEGEPLSQSGAGAALLGWLRLAASDLRRAEVMEWLMSSPLRFDRALPGFGEPPLALWDRLTVEAGIVSGHPRWRDGLAAIGRRHEQPTAAPGAADTGARAAIEDADADEGAAPATAERLRAASASLRRFMGGFLARTERFPRSGTWRDFAAAATAALDFYLQPAPHVRAVVEGLAGLDLLGLRVDLTRFTRALEAALDRQAPPVESFQRGGITVCDVARARGVSFRALIVVGLNERAFPQPSRQDPLLLDHERHALNVAARPEGEDDLLFATAVSSARERLVLIYARADSGGGRERVPSRYLLQLASAYLGRPAEMADLGKVPGYRRIAAGPAGFGGAPEDALDRRGYDIAALAAGHLGAESALPATAPRLAAAKAMQAGRFGAARMTSYDGIVAASAGPAHDLASRPVAPTALETYLTCPLRYFATRVLGLRPWEEPDDLVTISPLDRGELVHAALERTYRRAVESGLVPLGPERWPGFQSFLAEEFSRACDAAEARGVTGLAALWAYERAAIRADLETFVEKDLLASRGWTPHAFEVWFGEDPQVEWTGAEGKRLRFAGRIDRVDVRAAGSDGPDGPAGPDAQVQAVRVIDYKSGRLPTVSADLERGERLQLPIYLLAARRLYGLDSPRRCAAEYASTNRKGKFDRAGLDGGEWERIDAAFARAVAVASQGIAAGWYFPYPGKNGRNCTYCPVRPICPQAVGRQFERKAGAPEAQPFLALKEADGEGGDSP